MKTTVDKLSDTRVKLTVNVPFAELDQEIDQAYAAIAQQVSIPGFRKGKAPRQLIDARFGRGPILEQVVNDMLPSRYEQAVKENDLKVIGQPDVDISKIEDKDFVEFTAEVDIRPEFEIPDFSKISVTVPALKADEEDVDKALEELAERFGELKDTKRKMKTGDYAIIDITAEIDGEKIEDGTPAPLTPSSDTAAHAYVYRHREDVGGVVHTHSTYATAWAARREPIPCALTMMGDEFGGEIPVGPFTLIDDDSIGRGIVETLKDSKSPPSSWRTTAPSPSARTPATPSRRPRCARRSPAPSTSPSSAATSASSRRSSSTPSTTATRTSTASTEPRLAAAARPARRPRSTSSGGAVVRGRLPSRVASPADAHTACAPSHPPRRFAPFARTGHGPMPRTGCEAERRRRE